MPLYLSHLIPTLSGNTFLSSSGISNFPCVYLCFPCHACSSCSSSTLDCPCKFEVVFGRKPRINIHIFALIISISAAAAAIQAMLHKRAFVHDQQEDSTTSTDQENNVADSPMSGDEAYEVNAPSPKKRKGAQKRVISVPIGDGDGSRSRTEVYPPPDSWSWRKYGQKPIKGSPYPRGYYRCSSSKGCPARKQVERSRFDPTKLLITYSCEHNHPLPTTKQHQHVHTLSTNAAAAGAAATVAISTSTSSSSTATNTSVKFEDFAVFANQPDLKSDSSSFSELAGELGWFSNVGSTILDSPMLVGPTWVDADVALMLPIGEEDQSLFGDLGELPECSVVFRQARVADAPCCGSTG